MAKANGEKLTIRECTVLRRMCETAIDDYRRRFLPLGETACAELTGEIRKLFLDLTGFPLDYREEE